MDTAWNGYAAAALGLRSGAHGLVGAPTGDKGAFRAPSPVSPPARDKGRGRGERARSGGGMRALLQREWGGAGWGDACLLTKENEWNTLSWPAPPRPAWRVAGGGVSGGEGAGLSFTLGPSAAAAATGAEGRGLAAPGRWGVGAEPVGARSKA